MYIEELKTVRQINQACEENLLGGSSQQVYASNDTNDKFRITRARTVRGVLQVHRLNDGAWVEVKRVWR
jgi:hypothetical protein